MATRKSSSNLSVETLKHNEATRTNIPTAEYQSVMRQDEQNPIRIAYERRNRDLDPQLVWRGKDEEDWSDLVVHAPPLNIQKKVHPKVRDFVQMILENLKTAGVQQAHKEDKIAFTSLTPWPGDLICAESRYLEYPSPSPSP